MALHDELTFNFFSLALRRFDVRQLGVCVVLALLLIWYYVISPTDRSPTNISPIIAIKSIYIHQTFPPLKVSLV